MFQSDALSFLQNMQPKQWEKLSKVHGAEKSHKEFNQRGILAFNAQGSNNRYI